MNSQQVLKVSPRPLKSLLRGLRVRVRMRSLSRKVTVESFLSLIKIVGHRSLCHLSKKIVAMRVRLKKCLRAWKRETHA